MEVSVSSIGDARSLHGGTLILTPLKAANGETYALAQGVLAVGGYQFDFNGNRVQKNHPTVGVIANGGNVEKAIEYDFDVAQNGLTLVLKEPDFTTAGRIIDALNERFDDGVVSSNHPGRITIKLNSGRPLISLMSNIESLQIQPDKFARVVVNERNGTVVAGAEVRIDDVVISHGALKVKIVTRFDASQPNGFFRQTNSAIGSLVISNSDVSVEESNEDQIHSISGATIGDLVDALKALNLSTRDLISVLHAIKKAGALHADLIIQ